MKDDRMFKQVIYLNDNNIMNQPFLLTVGLARPSNQSGFCRARFDELKYTHQNINNINFYIEYLSLRKQDYSNMDIFIHRLVPTGKSLTVNTDRNDLSLTKEYLSDLVKSLDDTSVFIFNSNNSDHEIAVHDVYSIEKVVYTNRTD